MNRFLALFAAIIVWSVPAQSDPFWGALDGGFEGAIIGGILGGEEGAIDGAIIGGTIGAIDGAQREYERDRRYYRERYYPPTRPRPTQKPKSTVNLVLEVQLSLRRLGYNPGPADGIPGKATGRAILQYQRDNGLPEDNTISSRLLKHMRQRGG